MELDLSFIDTSWRAGIVHKEQVGPLRFPEVEKLFESFLSNLSGPAKAEIKASKPGAAFLEEAYRLSLGETRMMEDFPSWPKRQAVIETFEFHHIESRFEKAFASVRLNPLRKIEGDDLPEPYGNANWKRHQQKPIEIGRKGREGTADYFAFYAPAAFYGNNFGIYFNVPSILRFLLGQPGVSPLQLLRPVAVHELFHAFVESRLGMNECYHDHGEDICPLEEAAATYASLEGRKPSQNDSLYKALYQQFGGSSADHGVPGYGEYWKLKGQILNKVCDVLLAGCFSKLDLNRDPSEALSAGVHTLPFANDPKPPICSTVSASYRLPRGISTSSTKGLWRYYCDNVNGDLVPMYFDFHNR